MPSRPPRPCRAPACPSKTTAAHGYCDDHAHLNKPWVKKSAPGRGGRPWRRKRDAVMRRDKGLCQPCLIVGAVTAAIEVDHIIPVAEGGTDAESNLQAICGPCHKTKTQAEAQRGRQG